ncbi:GNAT family N-acetyltransferase [Halomarina salina]|uniref:GNAT family N-acetyltransferase n=1 Tax=Halomarina salina TaxID=1872699 RepID=A0ABD5RQD1_9EURY|nr:GNAT family protein [Halomarina salina]
MPGPVFLEGDAVALRPPEREDVEFLQRCMNDPRVWRPALDVNPMNRELGTEFFEDVLSSEEGVHCLACADAEPLGIVSLTGSQYGPSETSRARSMELAYWFAPEHHGQGYGSDAAARLVQYAFEDRNLRRVSARVGGFNDASVGLLESLGFEHEGTQREAAWFRGEYHDMLWYGLLRREWEPSPE